MRRECHGEQHPNEGLAIQLTLFPNLRIVTEGAADNGRNAPTEVERSDTFQGKAGRFGADRIRWRALGSLGDQLIQVNGFVGRNLEVHALRRSQNNEAC